MIIMSTINNVMMRMVIMITDANRDNDYDHDHGHDDEHGVTGRSKAHG